MYKNPSFIICLALITIPLSVFSQTGIIDYKHVINIYANTKRDDSGIKARLYFTSTKSLYIYNQNDSLKDDLVHFDIIGSEVDGFKDIIWDKIGERCFKDFASKHLISREFIRKKVYIIEDTLHNFNWTISKENKKINGIDCIKAITQFRGRKYEAWFAPSIPLNIGPWKLHGLPGAILEAYDTKKEVQFLIEKIEIPTDIKNVMVEPQSNKKITWVDFLKFRKDEEDRIRRLMSADPGKGVTITVSGKTAHVEEDEN